MDKKELIDIIKKELEKDSADNGYIDYYGGVSWVLELAEQLDEPKECELKKMKDSSIWAGKDNYFEWDCTACDDLIITSGKNDTKNWNYCPNCGAKINRT